MAFSKKNFVDNQTVIDADTLNAIQDELIRVAGLLGCWARTSPWPFPQWSGF